jgi:hypothetical protein
MPHTFTLLTRVEGDVLPEVREFITRHTAYNKHDTGCQSFIFNLSADTATTQCGI